MDFTHQSENLGGGIIYWPKLVHDETCSYVNLEYSTDDEIPPYVRVRDVIIGAGNPFLAASHMSLSAPSAKLNVAGAYFSFGGGENKS